MNLTLANPALLWLLGAAALPLLAHLVSRLNPPRKPFPTVEFLRRAMKRVWRWRKPQDWLLLTLRTLAVAALAAAFTLPVWLGQNELASAGEGKSLLLVVDRSASMQAVEEGQTRFSRASARALEILRGAGRLDGVNLVWMDAAPAAVLPGMGRAAGPVEQALQTAAVTDQRGDAPAALRLALERLAAAEGARELVVISDFQTANWEADLPAVPGGIRVLKIPVAAAPTGNLALTALRVSPAAPFSGESLEITCGVRNHSEEDRRVQLVVTLGEQRVSRPLDLPAGGQAQAIVTLAAPAEGEGLIQASLQGNEDALRGDDQRWAVTRPRPGLRVALALPEASVAPGETAVWRRLLGSLSWVVSADADPASADVLIFAGDEAATLTAAARVRARGGALIYRPSAASPAPADSPFSVLPGLDQARFEKRAAGDGGGWRLRIAREDAAWFQIFADGAYGDPARGLFQNRLRLPPVADAPDGWQLLLAYQDQAPALWLGRDNGGGLLWWWNATLDPADSTWAAQPAFLPLAAEAFLLCRPRERPAAHHEAQPGRGARFVPSGFIEGGAVSLRGSDGELLAVVEDGGETGPAWRSRDALRAGAYEWTLREAALDRHHPLGWTAVNFPEEEMNLATLPPEAVPLGEAATARGVLVAGADWKTLRDGLPLWPWLLAAALLFLLLEGVAAGGGVRSVKSVRSDGSV